MSSRGSVFKACSCVDPVSGKRLGRACAGLAARGHGSWYFSCSVADLWGERHRARRGGHASSFAAQRALDAVLVQSSERFTANTWTVARWLEFWLPTRHSIRPGTQRVYRSHIDQYLLPYLGKIRLADLTSRHVAAMFVTITASPYRRGQPYSPGTLQRIRATLRAALNGAIREGLLVSNVASRVELPNPRRPHPVVWTEQRIAEWRRTGIRPAVAVWNPHQLAGFLDHVQDERLYALWWLVALRGLRRGEAVGLPWDNVDLDRGQLTISQQLTVDASTFAVSEPKSRASHSAAAAAHRSHA